MAPSSLAEKLDASRDAGQAQVDDRACEQEKASDHGILND